MLAQIDIGESYNAPLFNPDPEQGIKGLGTLVSTVLSNVYIFAGLLLLILIIFGGFKMISASGTRDAQKAASARNTLTYAIVGFLLIFASYWIIQIVEKVTGTDILK